MGKCRLAPSSPTPPPAVPRSPSQCSTAQGSSRTCPANSQVQLESPPSSLSTLRDSASITSRVTPKPSLHQQSERSLKPPEGWHSLIQPTHRIKSQLFRKVIRPSPVYLIPTLAPTQGHPSRALQS